MGKIRLSSSNLRVAATELLGEQIYFDDMEASWTKFLESGGIHGMKLKWRHGMDGNNGIERGWKILCGGDSMEGKWHEGMVFQL